MGVSYGIFCPKCDYSFEVWLGVGMLYPKAYEETVQAAKIGALGEKMKVFFLEHPNGAIDASYVVGACRECGELENLMDLSMYVPKKGFSPDKTHGRWSVSAPFTDVKYVSPMDFEEHYKLFERYPHRCKKCGGKIKIFNEETIDRIKCPHCHKKLIGSDCNFIRWD